MISKGKVFIVAGISGSGKGTVCDRLIEQHSNLARPISVTTRVPRSGERFADHYYYVSKEIFQWLIETEQLLEHTTVWMNHQYGTLRLSVEQINQRGKHVLFEVDIPGIEQIKKTIPNVCSVFIKAPSEEEQRLRLQLRGTVGPEQDERVKGAERELKLAEKLGLPILVNQDLGQTIREVEKVFGLDQ